MLPSVSAGSAALTKYAQAIDATAPDQATRDGDTRPRPEQEAARHDADERSPAPDGGGELAREARAATEIIMETLRLRVLAALVGLGIRQAEAAEAADKAVAEVAKSIVADGRNAARIVHALLESPAAKSADPAATLLSLTARNLTVIVDRETGDIRVHLPESRIDAAAAGITGADAHLIDFTDRSPDQAAPALAALGAVHETAQAAASGHLAGADPVSALPPAPLVVSPRVFADAATNRLTALVRSGDIAAGLPVADIGTAVARIVAAVVNNATPGTPSVPVPEIASSLGKLAPAGDGDNTAQSATSPLAFADGRIAIAADPRSGAVTVQIGQRIVAFAPASLSSPATGHAPLPELETLPLPIVDIPADLPTGRVNDAPAGLPFVPPEIAELPAPGTPPTPATPPSKPTAPVARADRTDEWVPGIDAGLLKNASVVHRLEIAPAADSARPTLVSLDLSVDIAPGMQAAQQSAPLGGFGLPRSAPAASEDGPVMPRGHSDASANLIPVLPAWHARGLMNPDAPKPKPRNLPKTPYGNRTIEDAFDREMPEGHEGLVFSAVVFSV